MTKNYPDCPKCDICHQRVGGVYMLVDGGYVCEADYAKLFPKYKKTK